METARPSSPRRSLLQIMEFARLSVCIYVAAKLEIPDLLKDGPLSSDSLAQMTQTHAPSLYRVLRLLAGGGILREVEPGHFAVSPAGAYLQRDMPDSVRPWVLMYHEVNARPYVDLLHTVQTGESAFQHVRGLELFPFLAEHPEMGQVFDAAMTVESTHVARGMLDTYDVSGFDTVVDVGGGYGAFLVVLMQAHPAMRGILYDRTRVVEGARRVMAEAGLTDRCTCVGGSFFRSVPAGGDAYILKNVIHDWNDARVVEILRNCRDAMRQGGKILIIERLIRGGDDTSLETLCADLNMLMLGGGDSARERSEAQYRELLRDAGCECTRILSIQSEYDYYIIEAVPA